MVVIRLARGGAKKRPYYNLVVADSRFPRDGRYVEQVGFYNPMAVAHEKRLEVNMIRYQHWLQVGAQPSNTVGRLVREFKVKPSVEPVKV